MINMRVFIIMVGMFNLANVNASQIASGEENLLWLNVWLNGVERNVETLMLLKDNKHYIECQTLINLGLRIEKFEKNNIKKEFCLLDNPDVQIEKDESLQAIKINLPATYFSDASYGNTIPNPEKAGLGGFVNYDFFYSKNTYDDEFNTFAEVGIFKDYWLFKNAFIHRARDEQIEEDEQEVKNFVRLSSNFEMDFPENFLKLSVGDNTSINNLLSNSFRYGGISFGTNFTERPDFIYWNIPTLKGSAVLPSTVDLFVNGISLYRQSITPGNYSLQTGASVNQAGDAQIVVEDVLGNRTVQSFPIYINSQLLKKGLNEYNISLGKLRYNYDEVDDDYREFFTELYYRHGINLNTTLGFDISYSDKINNYNFLWTQAVSKFALLDVVYSLSDFSGENGHAVSLSLSREFSDFGFGINSRYFTQSYKSLGYSDFDYNIKYSNLIYFYLSNLYFFDGMNLSYADIVNYNEDNLSSSDSRVVNLGLQKLLTNNLNSSFNFYKDFIENDQGFNFSLTYRWGGRGRVNLNHSTDGNRTRLNYSNSTTLQNGFDYSIGVNRAENDINYNAYGLLKTNIGNLSLSHDENENFRNTQALFQGALVFLDNKVSLTKYVSNAFALVKVGDYKDLEILRSLSLVGKTNNKGYMFVHDIIPYINYDISFNHDQLAFDETFDYSTQKLRALDQRGYILNYPIYKTKKVTLHLVDSENKSLVRGSEVRIKDHEEESYFVDSKGLTYLYLLKPSKYPLSVKTQGGKECKATLEISENQFQLVDSKPIDVVCK